MRTIRDVYCSRPWSVHRAFSGLVLATLLLGTAGKATAQKTCQYRIERGGDMADCWLIGSIHLGRREQKLPPAMIQAIELADVVSFETNDTEEDGKNFVRQMSLPRRQTIYQRVEQHFSKLPVDDEAVAELNAYLKDTIAWAESLPEEIGIEKNLHRFQSDYVAEQLDLAYNAQYGFFGLRGTDFMLLTHAHQQDKEIRGLETAAEAFSNSYRLPVPLRMQALLEQLQMMDANAPPDTGTALAQWERGNMAYFRRQTEEIVATPEIGGTFRRMLVDRNKAWMKDHLRSWLTKDRRSHTIVVGTGHLIDFDVPGRPTCRGLISQIRDLPNVERVVACPRDDARGTIPVTGPSRADLFKPPRVPKKAGAGISGGQHRHHVMPR